MSQNDITSNSSNVKSTDGTEQVADERLTRHELIERYASIQGISYEEAELQIGAPTEEEILKKIEQKTIEKINATSVKMNRAQRRAFQKKYGKNAIPQATPQEQMEVINDTARKLSYIDLIQKLRKLNEEKAKENENDGQTTNETD